MNLHIKNYLIILFALNKIIANEVLFVENVGISFGMGIKSDTEVLFNGYENERKFVSINQASLSIFFKGKYFFNFSYMKKNDMYYSFNLPYSNPYYNFSINYFTKNKTSKNLNFNVSIDYLYDIYNLYNSSSFGFGVSIENDQQDFVSFSHLEVFYKIPSIGSSGFLIKLNYPIHLSVIPTDNIPSKKSYLFTPSLILDNKDIYFDFTFDVIHSFN